MAQRPAVRRTRLVGKPSQPGQPPRDLQRDPPRESRAHEKMMVIEVARKEEVGSAQQIRFHPERSVLPLALHALLQRNAAGEKTGHAVDAQEALPAAPAQAEGAARAVVLDRSGEGGDALAEKGRGDGVPRKAITALSIEREAERPGHRDGSEPQ